LPEEVKTLYKETIFKRGAEAFADFKESEELKKFLAEDGVEINIELDKNVATRVTSGQVIEHLNKTLPN